MQVAFLQSSTKSTHVEPLRAGMARNNNNKTAKHDLLAQTGRLFQPIATETLGPLNKSSIAFFSELGHKIASISGDNREPSFLFQRMSIAIQCFNSVLLHNSFSSNEE